MTKRAILLPLLTLWAAATLAQALPSNNLLGTWSGKLKVGASSLRIVFQLTPAEGDVQVTMDSPDQGARGIPAVKEFISNDSLAVKIERLGVNYSARLVDGKLCGTFKQVSFSAPFVLSKGEDKVKRPQTPQKPFPYTTQEVTFHNAKDNATLAGTLTWPVGYDPKSKVKPAVVLLVSGSGQQNRDEEIFEHKPFLVIADFLARQGIASLRYDDRATGASVGGDLANATTESFSRDAAAGLDFLRKKNAFSKVGLVGHSEGGAIAFILGAQGKADFIVSMAGMGAKGDTVVVAQQNRIAELMGQKLHMTVEKLRQDKNIMGNPWFRWFIDYDPSSDIAATRCPVLAINGDLDCQAISQQNLRAIERLLPKNKKNCVKEYPGLNHLFQHCQTGSGNEYRQIEETIAPQVLSDIANWIKGL